LQDKLRFYRPPSDSLLGTDPRSHYSVTEQTERAGGQFVELHVSEMPTSSQPSGGHTGIMTGVHRSALDRELQSHYGDYGSDREGLGVPRRGGTILEMRPAKTLQGLSRAEYQKKVQEDADRIFQSSLRSLQVKPNSSLPKPPPVVPAKKPAVFQRRAEVPVNRSYDSASIRAAQVELASAVSTERRAALYALLGAGIAALLRANQQQRSKTYQILVETQGPKANQHADPMTKPVERRVDLVAVKESSVSGEVTYLSLAQNYAATVELVGHDPAGRHRQSSVSAHEPMPLGQRGSGHWTPTGPRTDTNQLG
jgi:hypothetical protein